MRLALAPLVGSSVLLAVIAGAPGLLAGGCSSAPSVQSRTVTTYAPEGCAVAPSSALGPSPYALFQPLGDFQPAVPPASLPLSSVGEVLAGFPSDTREIVATITGGTQWAAHAILPSAGNIDLLALPFGAPCALTSAIDGRTNGALGSIDELHVLFAGGTSTAGVPRTGLIDLTRGSVSSLAVGLLAPRSNPSITSWIGGAVVAGGLQLDGSAPSFEIYSSSNGDFDGQTYPLSQARARHGAAVMASGETLLVGGVDPNGEVLGSMEAVDPVGRRARTGGLAFLQVPRANPTVMRLASGKILVAGGVDGSGEPVGTLEWFLPDGSQRTASSAIAASLHEAFVPLAAGGALAVVAPAVAGSSVPNVWVVSAAKTLAAATPIDGALTDVRLFDGTEQAPVLWTGDRWLVWEPWGGAFTALDSAIGTVGPTGDPTASPEPGLGVWIDGTSVYALRFGTRGAYATTPISSPLLLGAQGTSLTGPDQLVGAANSAATFDPETGLTLQSGASVFVTDATFDAFVIDAQTPGALPPAFVLRDAAGNETVLDRTACAVAAGSTIHLEREGGQVRASVEGGALVTCSAALAAGVRVTLGVRGEGVVRGVVITRTGM